MDAECLVRGDRRRMHRRRRSLFGWIHAARAESHEIPESDARHIAFFFFLFVRGGSITVDSGWHRRDGLVAVGLPCVVIVRPRPFLHGCCPAAGRPAAVDARRCPSLANPPPPPHPVSTAAAPVSTTAATKRQPRAQPVLRAAPHATHTVADPRPLSRHRLPDRYAASYICGRSRARARQARPAPPLHAQSPRAILAPPSPPPRHQSVIVESYIGDRCCLALHPLLLRVPRLLLIGASSPSPCCCCCCSRVCPVRNSPRVPRPLSPTAVSRQQRLPTAGRTARLISRNPLPLRKSVAALATSPAKTFSSPVVLAPPHTPPPPKNRQQTRPLTVDTNPVPTPCLARADDYFEPNPPSKPSLLGPKSFPPPLKKNLLLHRSPSALRQRAHPVLHATLARRSNSKVHTPPLTLPLGEFSHPPPPPRIHRNQSKI